MRYAAPRRGRRMGARVWVERVRPLRCCALRVSEPRCARPASSKCGKDHSASNSTSTPREPSRSATTSFAHVYVRDLEDAPRSRHPGSAGGDRQGLSWRRSRAAIHLIHEPLRRDHPSSESDRWFAYPFWLDDAQHPTMRARWRSTTSPVSTRANSSSIRACDSRNFTRHGGCYKEARLPHDARRGAARCVNRPRQPRSRRRRLSLDRPILIGHGRRPGESVAITAVRDLVLEALGLG